MKVRISSIRWRFVAAVVVVAAMALPAIWYTQNQVRLASTNGSQQIQEHRDLGWALNSLKDSLRVAENAIHQYPLSLDEHAYREILVRITETRFQSNQLAEHYLVKRYSQLADLITNLDYALDHLEQETGSLPKLLSSTDTRYPVVSILFNELYPANQAFIQASELAIAETEKQPNSVNQQEVLLLLKELRYAWAQQIGLAQIFVANRLEIFGQSGASIKNSKIDHELYVLKIDNLLTRITQYDNSGRLGFQKSLALVMHEAKIKYDESFTKIVEISSSKDWRADLSVFRNKIRPILDQSWSIIKLMQEELNYLTQKNMVKTLGVADTLSNFIWVFASFMALLLLMFYLIFEHFMRRPLLEVSKALNAVGHGENYLPMLPFPTQETRLLVDSFHHMQEQVSSRQIRLESILDNVAEGVITIDEKGLVETFNKTAEELFGYDTRQIVGYSIMSIIRFQEGSTYANFLELCQALVLEGDINEITVTVLRNNGSAFPIAIKVNKFKLEGRLLYIAIVEDVAERMAFIGGLRKMAEHDSLTGLYNRQYLLTELERVVENVRRGSHRKLALLYIDLDNFKFVNDTLGHLAGDQVLVEVTEMLSQRNRKSDLLARLGGEEFAILLYDVEEDQVLQAAEAHRKLLDEYVFKHKGSVIQLGCSIGVALFGCNPISKEDLLVQADVACHIAKRSGRNHVHVYKSADKDDAAAMPEDVGWAKKIKDSIEKDRFCLACQPVINLKNGETFHQEILLRMYDEPGNLILPAGFISSAERFGLMCSVDKWVVNNAIEYLGKQLKRNPKSHFSINLSAESINDSMMLETITSAMLRNEVPPTAVTFEITETIAIANLNTAIEFLSRLRDLGCQTALDDFGVGYSSFAYLKDLPVTYVKIDGSFVRDIHRDNVKLAMVRSMNDIAHAMGKYTIAEFVDSKECMDTLKEMGVDYVQGYYVGGPCLLNNVAVFQPESNVVQIV